MTKRKRRDSREAKGGRYTPKETRLSSAFRSDATMATRDARMTQDPAEKVRLLSQFLRGDDSARDSSDHVPDGEWPSRFGSSADVGGDFEP